MIKKRQGGKVVKIVYDDGTVLDIKFNQQEEKKEEPNKKPQEKEAQPVDPQPEDPFNIMDLPLVFDGAMIPPPNLDEEPPIEIPQGNPGSLNILDDIFPDVLKDNKPENQQKPELVKKPAKSLKDIMKEQAEK